MAICAFYKRRRNHMQLISSHKGGQYLRLMAISTTEIFGTIPLGTFYMVLDAKLGVSPWTGWASMHRYDSRVGQVAGFIWKNEPLEALCLEMFRWSLVACAFIFFALFGFTFEAREQYYGLYKFLTRVARQMSMSSALHGAPHAYAVFVHVLPRLTRRGSHYLFSAALHRCLMRRETVAPWVLSESRFKRIGRRTIRASHPHSPTKLRSCPFRWKALVIPIPRLCRIRIRTRTPFHFTLPKALMNPGCRTSAN